MCKKRCDWDKLEDYEIYKNYHDNEWGVVNKDDNYLFEMLVLESFHCGLSWLIILNKRENFRKAFDNFDYNIIKDYNDKRIDELMNDKAIVRHLLKIKATIKNAKAFIKVKEEFNTFSNYIFSFTNNETLYLKDGHLINKNDLSNKVSKDLKKRGFSFMGSVTTYSYLSAIGVMNNHSPRCFKYEKTKRT